MTVRLDRRTVLKATAATALPFLFGRCRCTDEPSGALVRDPAGILDLPEGFSYRILERAGDLMSDGYRVPGMPDGMACFAAPDGKLVLMRNHELTTSGGPAPGQPLPAEAYTPEDGFVGGVTRLVVDAKSLTRVSSNLVLVGTARNCAGGSSPWGWLSCEEHVSPGHGYVFLCDPAAASVRPPVRIPAFGKMNHEAAVIDPATGIAYLTEDRGDACFYRFVPDAPQEPPGEQTTGKLEVLRLTGAAAGRNLDEGVRVGERLPVEWVALPSPRAEDDSLRAQGRALGAAVFSRGEGIFLHQGAVYFSATTGGPYDAGQVWRYDTAGGGALTLIAQSTDRAVLDMPDNLCVAPWGDVVLAEDGATPTSLDQFLRILTPDGRIVNLARNARSTSELAGVSFSPDGGALFFNMQGDGLTFVVEGPFQRLTGTGTGIG